MDKETLAGIIGRDKSTSRIGRTDDRIRKNLMVMNLANKERETERMNKILAKADLEKIKEYWGG